uniref:Uncharacterized protein n=1 Tax=Panagrolaimus sp. ES5 TaxID=591445 RepID=A0AC34GVX8_9BILA
MFVLFSIFTRVFFLKINKKKTGKSFDVEVTYYHHSNTLFLQQRMNLKIFNHFGRRIHHVIIQQIDHNYLQQLF